MKFLKLIFRNAFRNKVRTTLTVGGSAFLMFVIVFMMTALSEMTAWEGEEKTHHRVVVQHATGLANWVNIGLENYLKGDEISRHASVVQKLNWFGGYYLDKKNFFAQFAVDHLVFREMWDELKIDDAPYKTLCDQKDACIVGQALATKYQLKVGQRITLMGTIYPIDPEMQVVGIFTTRDIRQEEQIFFRWDYMDELLQGKKRVGTYWLKARTSEDEPKLKELIDAHTKNSSDPTETMTEKEFGQQFAAMMGNVKGLIVNMSAAILLIMVMMTANTIAMSSRERVTEIAVMRTLGFGATTILLLILGESVMVNMMGAGISLAAAVLIFNVGHASPAPGFFPYFLVTTQTMVFAVVAALGAGLLSAAVPAIRAARRKIVDGLRQIV